METREREVVGACADAMPTSHTHGSQVRSAAEYTPWRPPQHHFCAVQVLRE